MISFTIPAQTKSQQHGWSSHWAVRARERKKLREATALCWNSHVGVRTPEDWCPIVSLTRISPRGKLLDDDNLRYVLKPVRDEIAKQLGVDDGLNGPVTWEYAQSRGPWSVEVILKNELEEPVT